MSPGHELGWHDVVVGGEPVDISLTESTDEETSTWAGTFEVPAENARSRASKQGRLDEADIYLEWVARS